MDKAKEQKSVEQLEKVKSNTKDQNLINKINEKISNINKPLNK